MPVMSAHELRTFQDTHFGADPLEAGMLGHRIPLTSAQAATYGHTGNLEALTAQPDEWEHELVRQLRSGDPALPELSGRRNILRDYLAIGSATLAEAPWGLDEPHPTHQRRYHILTPERLDETGARVGGSLLSTVKVTLYEPGDRTLPGNRVQRVVARLFGWKRWPHLFVEVNNARDWDNLQPPDELAARRQAREQRSHRTTPTSKAA